ncbi:unnamed protein product [Prorocentrum cordatum]|uniref:Uncharacterized protein n=1 Tax=Prorocentrum cordatum TaxID=2364126 RepID=A0ABN9QPB5_9DINO|nr:unnamed protein product [Polarella glacialis]
MRNELFMMEQERSEVLQQLKQDLAADIAQQMQDLQAKIDAIETREGNIRDVVRTHMGTSMSAKASAAQVSCESTEEQVDAFMELIERVWAAKTAKGQNLLHELCANLRQPSEQGGAEPLSPPVLAEVCREAWRQHGQKPL